jgi:hypothetical protein
VKLLRYSVDNAVRSVTENESQHTIMADFTDSVDKMIVTHVSIHFIFVRNLNADYRLNTVRNVNPNKCCQLRLLQGTSAFSAHVVSGTNKGQLPEMFNTQLH